MALTLEDNLNEDLVHIMKGLFQRGKTLHDYKLAGNKFGITIIIRLTDHSIAQPKFIVGKSPARQQRDMTRSVNYVSLNRLPDQGSGNIGATAQANSTEAQLSDRDTTVINKNLEYVWE